MSDRLTSGAQRAMIGALEQARTLGYSYIGAEHLLLGLVQVRPCPATRVLNALDVAPETVRERVLALLETGRRPTPVSQCLPFTGQMELVLGFSLRAAAALEVEQAGTEHLLLGLAREGGGISGRVLAELGVDYDAVACEMAALSGGSPEPRYVLVDSERAVLTDPAEDG